MSVGLAVQLLKLGCAHLIKTPFYLITDADTFYLNPFSAGELPVGPRCWLMQRSAHNLSAISACSHTEMHLC
jgi:Family of unknown function (DUF6492)